MMPGSAHRRSRRRTLLVWRWVAVLFTLRALLPVGFMPDFAAARDGRIALAFCTAGGLKTQRVDAAAASKDDGGKAAVHAADECPFGLALSPALPATTTTGLAVAAAGPDPDVSATASVLPPAPRGPPLGSRAPPSSLS